MRYTVEFDEVFLGKDLFLVPRYAHRRPACAAIRKGQLWEPTLPAVVQACMETFPGSIIHAGTFFGDMIPSFSRQATGSLFCYEPVLENYVLAQLSVNKNGLDNVVLFHAAIGQTTGDHVTVCIGDADAHLGGASYVVAVDAKLPKTSRTQMVATLKLDDLKTQKVSLVHLDLEGFEKAALLGSTNLLNQQKPIMIVEDNNGTCHPVLDNHGYTLLGKVDGNAVYVNARQHKPLIDRLRRGLNGPTPERHA